jgi:hypothetical protein
METPEEPWLEADPRSGVNQGAYPCTKFKIEIQKFEIIDYFLIIVK